MLSIYDDVADADIENNNWISYLYSICQNAYLKSSIIKIYSVTDKNIVWYKLNELPLSEDYEFISSTINGDLLLNTKLVFDAMKIKTERKDSTNKQWIQLNFRDLPSANIIMPLPTPSEPNLHTQLFKAYLNQKFTDVTLVTADKKFNLHKIVLYSMGGTFFERLYDSEFKQPSAEIPLPGYTSETVSIYIDYLYIGTVAFENHSDVDIIELFELSKEYLQLNLQRDCLNLINAQATLEDLDTLVTLNKRYDDHFLREIIKVLNSFPQILQSQPSTRKPSHGLPYEGGRDLINTVCLCTVFLRLPRHPT